MAKGKKQPGNGATMTSNASNARLQSFIDRIEHLEAERKALGEDVKAVYQDAADAGYDTSIMRSIIKARKMDEETRAERAALMEIYMKALGMLADTPLGEAAMERTSSEARAAVH